ncbi:RNA polymerase sigma factor [Paenibacillus macquariensis]|uniref:RNA polymerase sigma-70 factor, ECF subfamily n=1 Tax=Paenibacillus macquariensis TaxID=948756 RepID=A0ABY1KBF6_9BACL|nr:RNA polymerase sigma factor [Paenibacillus macquariensis]MEC0094279.1 RNA polymerase sigma factor [Paenibacillus macquariensis]OAB32170.1 RNA polymerase subunit sigma-24 [Paenibacillus macquariensis subsp. macquariensis]SIR55593.1 RNA polymerase sigma-70 factor, ECF subfamily [Paenibacillus macquariensis]
MNESRCSDEDFDIEIRYLVDKVQTGDKQAYALIIQRFQRRILVYCYYLLKSQEEAEDAAQDIFIKGLEHIHRYSHTVSLSAWLYKIAHNHCVDLIKKRNKNHQSLMAYKANREQEKDHGYTDMIHDLLEHLHVEERQILLLRSLEEYSFEEIAAIMDLKPATVRKQYERLRKKLIKQMNKGGKVYEQPFRIGG